jgi:predicted transcriptional regulator YdeE
MKKTILNVEEIRLIGLKVRTNNQNEFNPETAKIGACVTKYFQDQSGDKIPRRKNPGTTLCAYTDYESDLKGDYTYFIGEEVNATDNIPDGLDLLLIPAQTYVKFTTEPGPMPQVDIDAWQKIWSMSSDELGGTRSYKTDFEVYDERAHDPQNTVVDVYIGIKE